MSQQLPNRSVPSEAVWRLCPDNRLDTYSNWPDDHPCPPQILANAGFISVGFEDFVTCLHCGFSKGWWRRGDVPWEIHRGESSNCPFFTADDVSTDGEDSEDPPCHVEASDASPGSGTDHAFQDTRSQSHEAGGIPAQPATTDAAQDGGPSTAQGGEMRRNVSEDGSNSVHGEPLEVTTATVSSSRSAGDGVVLPGTHQTSSVTAEPGPSTHTVTSFNGQQTPTAGPRRIDNGNDQLRLPQAVQEEQEHDVIDVQAERIRREFGVTSRVPCDAPPPWDPGDDVDLRRERFRRETGVNLRSRYL